MLQSDAAAALQVTVGRMYNSRPGGAAPSVLFQGPHSEETRDSAAYASVSLSPPILSPQVTSSEAMRILASSVAALHAPVRARSKEDPPPWLKPWLRPVT